jgi:hypothetical protein
MYEVKCRGRQSLREANWSFASSLESSGQPLVKFVPHRLIVVIHHDLLEGDAAFGEKAFGHATVRTLFHRVDFDVRHERVFSVT